MNTLRTLVVGFVIAAFLALAPSGISLAKERWMEHHRKADIQVLRDAAEALKTINPELSQKVMMYADQEEDEVVVTAGEPEKPTPFLPR
jgi:hypothetical protein